ncbi:transcriptional regulator, AraC family [Chitinophaga sp. YR573]|uniref:AraC family transcriptional regulator n=1 Tax=Chitinophaga sp. YR573 TaxID=1881040 RepID=UPI0008C10D8E|nr:AraC family transcriptional regulator [Chitinophaga sp. YR573]SEV96375.1 transcriptional regulator, AraC family [Chitinophaga sp. YR573]
MIKGNLYQPFEIEYKELQTFPKTIFRNNFFNLIYVIEGTGIQYTNNNSFNYRKGNLFLITPEDSYAFKIDTLTHFFFLKFNDIYIRPRSDKDHDWVQRMEFILQNASHRPGCILKNKADKPMIASLIGNIIKEDTHQQLYHNKIIQQIVNTIIIIVARNIALKLPKNVKESTGEVVLDILHYIQQHILEPDKLRSEQLSKHFRISLTYLGRYFKKQTGETLQQYISNYKIRLIETRLLHTDMRINEISTELGFTDESHLNRAFRKYKGMSPSEFRKKSHAKLS